MNLRNKINSLPATSGVYLMKDREANVIYVGKAVSLRKRVQSYFRKTKTFKFIPIARIGMAHVAKSAEFA